MKGNKIKINVKKMRESHGLTQDAVAGKMGVSRRTYQRIETNPSGTEYKYMIMLANLYNCCVSQFEDETNMSTVDVLNAINLANRKISKLVKNLEKRL